MRTKGPLLLVRTTVRGGVYPEAGVVPPPGASLLREVVAVLQVVDEAGVSRGPVEQPPGELARHGAVEGHEPGEEGEVRSGVLGGDARDGQIEAAADDLRDLGERDAAVGDG